MESEWNKGAGVNTDPGKEGGALTIRDCMHGGGGEGKWGLGPFILDGPQLLLFLFYEVGGSYYLGRRGGGLLEETRGDWYKSGLGFASFLMFNVCLSISFYTWVPQL